MVASGAGMLGWELRPAAARGACGAGPGLARGRAVRGAPRGTTPVVR
jgi:hypothetical protein